jgi:TP901 family phage tail tape measure protein
MASRDVKLAIKIAGEIDKSLGSSVALTKKQIRSIAVDTALANMQAGKTVSGFNSWDKGLKKVNSTALKVTKTVGAGLAAAGATATAAGIASINAGKDFESAFAGIKKTVDATQPELDELENSIRRMSKEKPQTAVTLAGIGESAGQLGIQTQNIEGFIDTVSDLTVATNLLADQGASDMARFANITGMSQTKFSNFGSTIVALGNSSATTEAEILDMAMRIAAAGTQVNMSQPKILGLAAALSSVGMEAEAGGSAASKSLIDMQLAVETGSEALSDYASVAGMTREEFARLFKSDSARAFAEFVSGLNNTERNGKSAIAVLNDMGIKEVRLRDALLRAANASDIFNKSFETADKAWAENIALAKEAEQRYATFDSRLQILQNRVNDTGISIYKNFTPALNDILGLGLDLTEDGLFSEDFIADLAESMQENIPTVVREVKEAGNAFEDFAGPIFGVAIENLDLIEAGVYGVAGAIVSANIIKLVGNTAKTFQALKVASVGNPLGFALTAGSALIGGLIAIDRYMQKAREQSAKDNLAEHFGDIALSMEDLDEAAEHIVYQGNLAKYNAVIEEMGKASDVAENLDKTSASLDKLNWKIETGIELTRTENQDYKNYIDKYIADATSYIEQRQYTAALNIDLLLGNSEEGEQLKSQFNSFYGSLNTEISDLGRQLGEVYADAMTDGMLDPQEAERIAGIQKNIAELTQQMQDAKFEAGLDALGIKYGGSLTADSFINLQAEIQKQLDEADEVALKSQQALYQDLSYMLEKGAITDEQYKSEKDKILGGYLDKITESRTSAFAFQAKTIENQYAEALKSASPQIEKALSAGFDELITSAMDAAYSGGLTLDEALAKMLGTDQLGRDTVDAIADLWKYMEPQYKDMWNLVEQYEEAGRAVPQSLIEGLSDASVLGAIAGNQDAIWGLMIANATGSSEYATLISQMQDNGIKIPEAIADGIDINSDAPERSMKNLYTQALNAARSIFAKGFDINAKARIKIDATVVGGLANPTLQEEVNRLARGAGLVPHASGGIFSTPHIGLVAEAGTPEAVIPLNNSARSQSLWEQAGEIMGRGGDTGFTITFAPVYQISGNASSSDVERISRDSYEEFERNMDRWYKDKRRLSFRR